MTLFVVRTSVTSISTYQGSGTGVAVANVDKLLPLNPAPLRSTLPADVMFAPGVLPSISATQRPFPSSAPAA
jgi:hypothetical protein